MPISIFMLMVLMLTASTVDDQPELEDRKEAPVTVLRAAIVGTYPHQSDAFTQGLLFADGVLIESTGLRGQSRLRKLSLRSGNPVQEVALPDDIFAEGTALVDNRLVTLTYTSGQALVFDQHTLEHLDTFTYEGEGWGLTFDGDQLIMSDGSHRLRFIDPDTFEETHRIAVTLQGQPLTRLNELEYINDKVWANVWMQDFLVRIDPKTGIVDQVADLRGLFPHTERKNPTSDVLNGIAYEPRSGRLFVTGKNWPHLFEITLEQR